MADLKTMQKVTVSERTHPLRDQTFHVLAQWSGTAAGEPFDFVWICHPGSNFQIVVRREWITVPS